MIGRLRTTHPTEGYGIIAGFKVADNNIRITSISDSAGKDIFGSFTSEQIQELKRRILDLESFHFFINDARP